MSTLAAFREKGCLTGSCNDCGLCLSQIEKEKQMSNTPHLAATDALATLGTILGDDVGRDAIHIAVEPVIAAVWLKPGQDIGIISGKAAPRQPYLGIVDPFLNSDVRPGQRFWMMVYPRTITSLRHVWQHPSFADETAAPVEKPQLSGKEASIKWMADWAMQHMSADYYGDYDTKLSPETAYAQAIDAGHENHIGPYEEARDYIDDEWWDHWEAITGAKGKRGTYFSCGC